MRSRPVLLVLGWMAIAAFPGQVSLAASACAVVEGAGIDGVRIGMAVTDAFIITGPPLAQRAVGSRTTYALRAPWSHLVAEYGLVQRVATRAPQCRVSRDVGVGSTLAAVRQAYAGASVSTLVALGGGDLLTYPFLGVAFSLRNQRVEAVEVFAAERVAATQLGPPTPGPDAPAAAPSQAGPVWTVRALSTRLDDMTFIVTGTVENRGRPVSAYAEVNAYNPSGRLISSSDGPFYPNPVPTGKAATFEARLTIDDVVSRYAVIVRPVGSIAISLAGETVSVRDLQQFARIVARKLQAAAEFRAGPPRFVVTVRSRSAAPVSAVTVALDITGSCFQRVGDLIRTTSFEGTQTVVVQNVPPNGSGQATLDLLPVPCDEIAFMTARPTILTVRIEE